jgi:ABC-type transport system involved in multi-copper enzyme maturation permease subunit
MRASEPSEEDPALTIMPILSRELLAAARRGRIQRERSTFAATQLVIVLGTFGVWYYLEGWHATHHLMARVALQAFLFIVAMHALSIFGGAAVGAAAIASEKDRRTLDFLLATPLGNAEIVLGKLAAWFCGLLATVAAGLPVVLFLNLLGGVDPLLILLAYAGTATTAFVMIALALWISSGAPDARRAINVATLSLMAWLIVPFLVSLVLPRLGLPLPAFVMTVNAWVLASTPLSLFMKFAIGGPAVPSAIPHAMAWMGSFCSPARSPGSGRLTGSTWVVTASRWARHESGRTGGSARGRRSVMTRSSGVKCTRRGPESCFSCSGWRVCWHRTLSSCIPVSFSPGAPSPSCGETATRQGSRRRRSPSST